MASPIVDNRRLCRVLIGLLPALLLTGLVVAGPCRAGQDVSRGGIYSINDENDRFGSAGTDRYYTNGIKLSCVPAQTPAWADRLGDRLRDWEGRPVNDRRRVVFSLGQNIYTPQDIERSDLIAEDRPYGGWLYLGLGIHDRQGSHLDSSELILGMVGPQSYAGDTQIWWHKNIIGLENTREPKGWDNQLENEFGLVLIRERKWRVMARQFGGALGFDAITHLGGAFGNIYTYGNTGGEVRFGWHLPEDFGSSQSRPAGDASVFSGAGCHDNPADFAVHFFARLDGRLILRNIFIDGNTFAHSHSVDRDPWVADLSAGTSLTVWKNFNLTFTHVYRTKEFKNQPLSHIFGSITLSYLRHY